MHLRNSTSCDPCRAFRTRSSATQSLTKMNSRCRYPPRVAAQPLTPPWQYRHFESSLELTKLKPQTASKEFALLVMFCCHVTPTARSSTSLTISAAGPAFHRSDSRLTAASDVTARRTFQRDSIPSPSRHVQVYATYKYASNTHTEDQRQIVTRTPSERYTTNKNGTASKRQIRYNQIA